MQRNNNKMTVDFSIETMKASGQWNGSHQGLEENKTANLEFYT